MSHFKCTDCLSRCKCTTMHFCTCFMWVEVSGISSPVWFHWTIVSSGTCIWVILTHMKHDYWLTWSTMCVYATESVRPAVRLTIVKSKRKPLTLAFTWRLQTPACMKIAPIELFGVWVYTLVNKVVHSLSVSNYSYFILLWLACSYSVSCDIYISIFILL